MQATSCPLALPLEPGLCTLSIPSCRLCITIIALYSVESTGLSSYRDFLFHGPEPRSSKQNLGVSLLFHKHCIPLQKRSTPGKSSSASIPASQNRITVCASPPTPKGINLLRASGTTAVCSQVVVPTRVGQGYVYEAPQTEQDEYDTPRHLLAPGPQDIYDVPPVRGLLPNQYGQEVGAGDQRHGRVGAGP